MTKLKIRFWIVVLKFVQFWAIDNSKNSLLAEANNLKCDRQNKLEEL